MSNVEIDFSTIGDDASSLDRMANDTSAESANRAQPVPPVPPGPSTQVRLAAVSAARNPLLEAAQPLLRTLADLPETLAPNELDLFHELLVREVDSFQSVCNIAQIRHEHVVGASYALCTAIDERAQSTRWGAAAAQGAGVWAARQLAVVFHDDARGGDKVFLLIGRLVSKPDEHIDLIEVLYFILGLGFEGRYGAAANGRRQIEAIRHRLYLLLAASRAEVPQALSPQLQREGNVRTARLRFLPPWVTASAVLLALLVVFCIYRYRLLQMESDAVGRISTIGTVRRVAAVDIPVRALRLKELLASEIARGTVEVEESAAASAVSFRGDEMFIAGQARLNPRIVPTLSKVAGEIDQVPGAVKVVGHTDDRPIKTGTFPDNRALSERRAAVVAEVLSTQGVDRRRLTVEGRADTAPVADNSTAAGRARNRRVDIVVTTRGPAGSWIDASSGAARPSHAQP